MMGFEVIVRPVVFPNIRPVPAQSRPPASDLSKGMATIHGANGKFFDLAYSWSASTSQSRSRETKRRFDVARVYQMDDDGTVNNDNFVDIEVAKKIWMKDAQKDTTYKSTPVKERSNIEIKYVNKIKRPEDE